MADLQAALSTIFRHEGGLVDHPSDPGGITNYGISARFLIQSGRVNTKKAALDMVLAMTKERAGTIYRDDWWRPMNLAAVYSQTVATKVLDLSINMGIKTGAKMLQRCVNIIEPESELTVDGILGPVTILAANRIDPYWVMAELRVAAANRYRSLITRNPNLAAFRKGWMRRAYE